MNRKQRRALSKAAPSHRERQSPAVSDGLLEMAIRHHRTGKLPRAERLYQTLLTTEPAHPDALHLLGIVAHQNEWNDLALGWIRRAIVVNGAIAPFHSSMGAVLLGLARPAEAATSCRAAIRIKSDYAEAHTNLGNAQFESRRFAAAIAAHRSAIVLMPDDPELHLNSVNTLLQLEQVEAAVDACNRAIRVRPDFASAYSSRGHALSKSGRSGEAARSCKAALVLSPAYAEGYANMAALLTDRRQSELGHTAYNTAIRIKPDYVKAHFGLGNALTELGRPLASILSYKTAIGLQPDHAGAYVNMGTAMTASGQSEKAVIHYRTAIRLMPEFVAAHSSLGGTLHYLGRFDEALECFTAALRTDPNHPETHYNEFFTRLLRGELAIGWPKYEWRWRGGSDAQRPRDFPQPRWRGETLDGRTILLHAEQGLGDCIQFCRYAPLVAARGGRVILEAPRPLLRLLSTLAGVDRMVATGDPVPDFDLHCPLMSLPGVFATGLESIPAQIPYLGVDQRTAGSWVQRLAEDGTLRVGLVWAGNPNQLNDRNRSIPFSALANLWRIKGVRWYSLQVGIRQADLAAAPFVTDLSPHLSDFSETAGALKSLDLVLSVCTSVAHAGGALGCPTWVMLPFTPDWRWLLDRPDSPWYPSMRLYRQTRPGDWAEVISRVAAEMAIEIDRRSSNVTPG